MMKKQCNGDEKWLEELKEYKALEEQGKLVKLPYEDVHFSADINNPIHAMVKLARYQIENIDENGCKYK